MRVGNKGNRLAFNDSANQRLTLVDGYPNLFAVPAETNYILTVPTQLRSSETPMPQTPHIERHFTAGEVVRDVVIGMSDGLTVPFALAAGLTGGLAGTANSTS